MGKGFYGRKDSLVICCYISSDYKTIVQKKINPKIGLSKTFRANRPNNLHSPIHTDISFPTIIFRHIYIYNINIHNSIHIFRLLHELEIFKKSQKTFKKETFIKMVIF